MKDKAEPQDTFVLAFSGHGMRKNGRNYLLTYYSGISTAEYTALGLESLKGLLGSIKAERKLVILDACRNDPESGKGEKSNPLTESFSRGVSASRASRSRWGKGSGLGCAIFL